MRRRKFIAGLGSLTAAGAAGIGTGAFSAMSAERSANINVVSDGDGLVALQPGPGADSHVYTESGEVKIDLSTTDAGGVNVDSWYKVGGVFGLEDPQGAAINDLNDPGGPTTNAAVEVFNQDTATHDITVEYEADQSSLNQNGSWLCLNARPLGSEGSSVADGTGMPIKNLVVDYDDPADEFTYGGNDAIVAGGGFGISIYVDTTRSGASTSEDLSGTLTVSAD